MTAHLSFRVSQLFGGWIDRAVGDEDGNVFDDRVDPVAGGAGDLILCQAEGLVAGWAGERGGPCAEVWQDGFFGRGCHGWPLLDDSVCVVARLSGAALGAAGEFALDTLVSSGFGELVGHADAVEDGVVVRRAVPNDADAAHA